MNRPLKVPLTTVPCFVAVCSYLCIQCNEYLVHGRRRVFGDRSLKADCDSEVRNECGAMPSIQRTDFQSTTPLFFSLPEFLALTPHYTTAAMAPSLEEPTQVDLDAPLKSAPKLVAPEPGITASATLSMRR